jgi:hypothetical protein
VKLLLLLLVVVVLVLLLVLLLLLLLVVLVVLLVVVVLVVLVVLVLMRDNGACTCARARLIPGIRWHLGQRWPVQQACAGRHPLAIARVVSLKCCCWQRVWRG